MRLVLPLAFAAAFVPVPAFAQQPTTVQLPTFHVFTVQTTVSVPDSGGNSPIAGIQRSRNGRLTRGIGPLASSSGFGDRSAGGVGVHATVIDHHEIDAALAAAAARRSGMVFDAATSKAGALSRHVGRNERAGGGGASLAAIRASNEAAAAARDREAAELFARGQQAEAGGKTGAAKVYYQMAARLGSRAAGQKAADRLATLSAEHQE